MAFPILDVIILLPLGVALIVALLPESAVGNVGRALALSTAAVELALALWTVVAFKTGNAHAGFQFTSKEAWIGPLSFSWHVGVDGISLFLMTMTALLFPIAMASPRVEHSQRAYLGWMLLLESACMATFLSLDAFLFFIAFEATLVPGYFLIITGAVRAGLRRHQVFPVHVRGLGVPVRGHPRRLLPFCGARAGRHQRGRST